MLNRILFKKIKSPLSLRGLFPFCHSRESGNPSSMSFRGAKQRNNLKGFSLIELMVAVIILAIAVLGIFLAFSSGWMGMADARDRTVATNYVQEILEDIKNTPFEKIHSDSSQIGDTKFSRNINSININQNIKEVTVQVIWDNWKDSPKSVEASTLIYSQISSESTSEAVALVLYAEPYYNILPDSSNTRLTVLVQDKNGNLVTDGEKDIEFLVDDSSMGSVLPSSIATQNGKATVYFNSLLKYGEVVIVASSDGLTDDSVTLKITDAAVAIKLEADPATIPTGGQSVITVSLLNASYVNPPATIDEHLVVFEVKEGPGTITPISVLLNDDDDNDTASIVLTSSGTPGIVTIIASSMDLESGVVNIPILGSAKSISITATPSSIFLSENTEITVTIKDSAGNPVIYSGDIQLSLEPNIEPNNGYLSAEGSDYDEVTGILTFSIVSASSKSITYTASDSDAGEVDITAASAISGELSSDTVTIYIYEDLRILLTATPEIIMADGESSSTITATIVDLNNDIVTGGTHDILFEIVSGEGNLSDYFQTTTQTTQNGVASIKLTSTINPSLITVSARANNLTSDSVTVQTTIPKFISISADKDWLYEGDEAVISINVVDGVGDSVAYSGSIYLILSDYGLGSITPDTFLSYPGEEVTAYFTASSTSTGEVTITADGEGINSDSITIQILGVGETILTWADNMTVSSDEVYEIITFDISIWGGPLVIEQMQVNWDPLSSSYLSKISIDSNIVIDNATANPEDEFIDIINTPLPSGTSTIGLYFSEPMNGETITVIFFDNSDPQIEYGPLEFTIE